MLGEINNMCTTRILILDDAKNTNGSDTYLTLKTVLQNNGFEVDSFRDPSAALKKVADGLYDLVLVDLTMSYMNDFDLYQKMMKINNKLKIYLLCSGIIHHELIRHELSPESEKTYCSILRKPFENEDLVGLLSIILN
jgi:two-component system, sensor histidine kinase and response regulator